MAFCVTYTITCMCITVPSLPILFLGRVLGGISTSILYSAFESWLVSSSNHLALHQSALSNILGRATLINGIVAAIAGVVSNKLVSTTLTFKSPFIASGALLVLAWFVINRTWHENRGGTSSGDDDGIFQLRRLGQAWHIVKSGEPNPPGVSNYPNSLQILSCLFWGSPRPASRDPCTFSFLFGFPHYKKPHIRLHSHWESYSRPSCFL